MPECRESPQSRAAGRTPAGRRPRRSTERRNAENQRKSLEALQLKHQDGDHGEQHQWRDGDDGDLRFLAFLDRSADRDPRVFCSSSIAGPSELVTASCRIPGLSSACTVSVGTRRGTRQRGSRACSRRWQTGLAAPFGHSAAEPADCKAPKARRPIVRQDALPRSCRRDQAAHGRF